MNKLIKYESKQIFYKDANIRYHIDQDGQIWYVAKDVCQVIGIKSYASAVAGLTTDFKGLAPTETVMGNQNMSVVNDRGLVALILKSKKPEALEFQKWNAEEMIPNVMKTGTYTVSSAQSLSPSPVANMAEYTLALANQAIALVNELKSKELLITTQQNEIENKTQIINEIVIENNTIVQQLDKTINQVAAQSMIIDIVGEERDSLAEKLDATMYTINEQAAKLDETIYKIKQHEWLLQFKDDVINDQQEIIEAKDNELQIQKPFVDYAKTISCHDESRPMKAFCRHIGYGIEFVDEVLRQKRRFMTEWDPDPASWWKSKHNKPFIEYVKAGWFVVNTINHLKKKGSCETVPIEIVEITAKGEMLTANLIKNLTNEEVAQYKLNVYNRKNPQNKITHIDEYKMRIAK